MIEPARRFSVAFGFLVAALTFAASSLSFGTASAQGLYQQPRYAAIVVDANSGEVLYARRADALRYPASITKVMTLYLTFEAMASGKMTAADIVPMSSHAASQAPTKLGVRAGDAITVDQAIKAITTKSANDVAVALAERIGGTESRFAALMTLRAQELGMTNTRFVNASGLPDNRQITTARDIAILSRAVMRDYPQYYAYFSVKEFDFRGRTIVGHNGVMNRMPWVDGLKTGYTAASGYNLAASGVRDGQRLITVVLGGSSTAARDENVEELLTTGFDVLAKRKMGQNITLASAMSEPEDVDGPVLRPSVEQGSADQAGLQIVLADAHLRGIENASYGLSSGDGVSAAILRSAVADSATQAGLRGGMAENCGAVHHSRKVKLGRGRHAKTKIVTSTSTVCRNAPMVAVGGRTDAPAAPEGGAIAKADCVKVGKGRHRHTVCKAAKDEAAETVAQAGAKTDCVKVGKGRHRHTVCKAADAQVASAKDVVSKDKAPAKPAKKADDQTADADSGRYLIQVGAFKSRGDAQDHLAKMTHKYGGVVASAGTQVQSAGNGNYRARFSGFTAKEAKSACKALSAKGERCMVMSASS